MVVLEMAVNGLHRVLMHGLKDIKDWVEAYFMLIVVSFKFRNFAESSQGKVFNFGKSPYSGELEYGVPLVNGCVINGYLGIVKDP